MIALLGMIVGVVLAFLLGIVITRMITRPLFLGVEFATALSDGNLAAKLDVNQKDEIGDLAEAMRNMQEKLVGVVSDVKSAANNVASGSEQKLEAMAGAETGLALPALIHGVAGSTPHAGIGNCQCRTGVGGLMPRGCGGGNTTGADTGATSGHADHVQAVLGGSRAAGNCRSVEWSGVRDIGVEVGEVALQIRRHLHQFALGFSASGTQHAVIVGGQGDADEHTENRYHDENLNQGEPG